MESFDARARTWDADPRKLAMARTVAERVAARVPDLVRARVLEVGAGTGLLGFALCGRAGHVTLADGSAEMLAVAREKLRGQGARNVDVRQLDLEADPLPDVYEVICAQLVLHHVKDTAALLRKLHGGLVPGGHLCISDLDAEDGAFHGPGFEGHDGFDRQALGARMVEAGFEPPEFETAFEIRKEVAAGGERNFPVFLAIARRP